jgi:ubiquinone/menaquinone biosynthesis C-methylase UbiE
MRWRNVLRLIILLMADKPPYHSASDADVTHTKSVKLPYFDYLLATFKAGNSAFEKSFGRHVHWGYWEHPQQATLTGEDFAQATENLSRQVCLAGHIQNNQRVLDVGCGFGGTVAHINENFQSMDLVGINLDERQLARARELVKPIAKNTIEFKQGNACALPLPDQSFDVVLAVECIFHFPDREQFFKEAHRVLKPGGYLALSDFVSKPQLQPLAKAKLFGNLTTGFYGKCDFRYGVADYRNLAPKTGFTLQTERDITVYTLPTYRYLRRLSQEHRVWNLFALIETATAEVLSKLKLLDYMIYGYHKPK